MLSNENNTDRADDAVFKRRDDGRWLLSMLSYFISMEKLEQSDMIELISPLEGPTAETIP